ncbi:hypothetical protein B4589_007815 [Halolamina sp. CBA1230]|uniref:hypothetical protein n=1 Tax=Halolamina sp. CBA1230 TaxID=1853690 RepID=UPI0009A1ADE5|nr:hypothetical protein [Halolamina sp. CBA1230]QKY20289.1 hypothetical protein B4589_007815 [Halolamina sp. CBA1230]
MSERDGSDDEAWDRSSDDETDEAEEREVPLSALRERIEAEREAAAEAGEESPFETVAEEEPADVDSSELFEEVDVGDIDGEAVWDAMVEGDAEAEELLGGEPRMESDAEPAAEPTETPDEHVVDKREYCQRCEFFAAPPNATCTNEGTEIVELVDNGHFRVRGCPKVTADDEALSGFATDGE